MFNVPYELGENPSSAEILRYIHVYGLNEGNFEELVPKMLRAVCKDESIDDMEKFVKKFESIDWNWYPNG